MATKDQSEDGDEDNEEKTARVSSSGHDVECGDDKNPDHCPNRDAATPREKNGLVAKKTQTSKTRTPRANPRWSWVILVATFFNYIVVSAIWYSFSVLYHTFADHFDKELAPVGVLASVEAAALHFTGAFCSGLVERYGSRPVAMVGSFIAALALLCGAFVKTLTQLYVVYGLAGSGIGLSYVSFVVIIQQYFNKRRTIASGFSLTGFSIASFSLPPFTRWLLDKYSWRGTLMIISGFYLNGVVLAALLRPPPPAKTTPNRSANRRQRTRSFSQKLTRQMSYEKTKSRMSRFCSLCRKVMDCRMFLDPRFVLYGLGTFFMMIGNIAFFMHLINRAVSLGVEKNRATFLPSIYGVANGLCRLFFSFVANLPRSNRTVQYGLWIVAGGFISCMSSFATSFEGLAVVCALFGMCVGAFICIQYPALVDLLGVQKIARSTGLLQIFIGAAGLIATPLAGWIYDETDDYNIPYFVLGAIMMLGGGIILVIPCLGRGCRRRNHGNEKDEQLSDDDVFAEPAAKPDGDKGDVIQDGDDEDSTGVTARERTLSSSSYLQFE